MKRPAPSTYICPECELATDGQPCPFPRCPKRPTTQGRYVDAAAAGQQARHILMRLDLPEGASKELVKLWNAADIAILDFLQRLERETPDQERPFET